MKKTDYLVLVNQLNALPEDWYETLETVLVHNRYGETVELEKQAYMAYQNLEAELEENGIFTGLDSALRSIEVQQKIMDDFTAEYGASYAEKTVAPPGYSEHHTGLALDLFLIVDGEDTRKNEELVQYPELWEAIHNLLPKYGFILRYPKGKEHITGYGYEPWHIRYVKDLYIAEEIMRRGVSLEEYLGAAEESEVSIDYGTSAVFTEEELYEASVQIRCRFAAEKNRRLVRLQYCGDQYNTAEAVRKLNSDSVHETYIGIAVFQVVTRMTAGRNQEARTLWVLGRTDRDGWDIIEAGQECIKEIR